jgi:hypothetical protein
MMNSWAKLAAILCASIASAAVGQTTVLYNGASDGGTTDPTTLKLLAFAGVGSPMITSMGGKTTFDTTSSNAIEAGYSNQGISPPMGVSFPTLNPTTGFTIDFDMKLDSETHTSSNRAGFSVIALGSDNKGIEIGFWTPIIASVANNIWVQGGPTFTQAEGTQFDDETSSHDYQLSILGGNYTLFADGSQILTGSTRNYSAAAIPPYTLSNFLFFGDDTTSAAASEEITYLAVTVPEPVTGALTLALVGIGLFVRPRRIAI